MDTLKLLQEDINALRTEERRLYTTEVENEVPDELKDAFVLSRAKLTVKRGGIENINLNNILSEEANVLEPELRKGIKDLRDEIDKLDNFIKLMETLSRLIGLASSIVSIAAASSSAPFAIAKDVMEARTSLRSRVMMVRAEPEAMLSVPQSVKENTIKKTPLFLVEEVLHGVQLTQDELIITVATGGCTKEGDFRFDVNKSAVPYVITVYRIEPDDCDGNFEPIPIAYSRKELGLDGAVEFILRNRIGNTSNHRLPG